MAGMKLLVLGGTAWLGHTIAATAIAAGHEVTSLARGVDLPEGATLVHADRDHDDALSPVAGVRWDAVIDVARQPGHVRRSVRDLESATDQYVLVSSGNAYASQEAIGQNEDAPRLEPLDGDVMASMEDYGAAKVACEDAVLGGFGVSRAIIARAGLIGGPGDVSGQTGYWPRRFAGASGDGAAVLVPDAPELPTAVIDVRDLATWLVQGAEGGFSGVFNALGTPVPFLEHLDAIRMTAGHEGPVVRAPEAWLSERGVHEWSGPRSMPLWLADRSWYGMNARSNERALAAGLTLRPISETIADTLRWELGRDEVGPHGAGLADAEERDLLAELSTTD
jgi:2'-hydroxyisoflavone reductase